MTVKKALAALLILLLCTACANQKLPVSEGSMEKPEETFAYIENEDVNNCFPRLAVEELVQAGQYLFGTGAFSNKLILLCYDLSGNTAEVACGKPDCAHDNEECNAYFFRDTRSLSFYHDHLYWLGHEGQGPEKMNTLAIRRMDPFTGTRETVRSVDWNMTMIEYSPQRMRVHRGTAYLECEKQMIVEDAPDPRHKLSLLAMPLSEKGETKVLFERDYDCFAEMQVRYCGNYIYLFCTLWTSEPTVTWYEIYKVDIRSGKCEEEVAKLKPEPDCYINDFWVDNDYRMLAAGQYRFDYTKSFVWQIEDGALKELFSFEAMNDSLPYLFDQIAVIVGYDEGERPCCIRDFDGNVLFDGKLTLPTQIPDLYLPKCKINSIDIMGGDRGRLFVSYGVSDNMNVNDTVTMLYDIRNNMDYLIIWTEDRYGAVP